MSSPWRSNSQAQRQARIYEQSWRLNDRHSSTSTIAQSSSGPSSQRNSSGTSSITAPTPATAVAPLFPPRPVGWHTSGTLSTAFASSSSIPRPHYPLPSGEQNPGRLSPSLLPSLAHDIRLAASCSPPAGIPVPTLATPSSQASFRPQPSGFPRSAYNSAQTMPIRPPPGFPSRPFPQVQNHVQPRPILPPPGIPMPTQQTLSVPQGQGILTTMDRGPGPERLYTLMRVLERSTGGVDYLVCDNENGGLWYGHFNGPKAYFYMRDNQDSFPIHGFKVGNKEMFPTCPDIMFPLFDPTMMKEYVPGVTGPPVQDTDEQRLTWPDVFGALSANKGDYSCREAFAKELAVNAHLAVCSQPYLALYKGVVVKDMHGGPRVTYIVYGKYDATLWEFVNVHNLLQTSHFDRIVTGVREGIQALHKKSVVHRQVTAKNVYLSYVVKLPLVYIVEVKLGNFEEAQHCVTGQELEFLQAKRHDNTRQVLLEEWLRYVLRGSGRMLSDQDNATNAKMQEGLLGGTQLEEVEGFLDAQLNRSGPWKNTASDTKL